MKPQPFVRSLDTLRRDLLRAYDDLPKAAKKRGKAGGWRKVGRRFKCSPGMAYAIAKHGYNPARQSVRRALGLPDLLTAPACARCGNVHVTKRCTNGGQAAKPRRIWQRACMEAWGLLWGQRPQ